jgi:hypothetical protein
MTKFGLLAVMATATIAAYALDAVVPGTWQGFLMVLGIR